MTEKSEWFRLIAPGPQKAQPLKPFDAGDYTITAMQFGPPKGPFPKMFVFGIYDKKQKCPRVFISAGSYEPTTQAAREAGKIGKEERLFHVDLYGKNRHDTLYLNKQPPDFKRVLSIVRKLVEGEAIPAISSNGLN